MTARTLFMEGPNGLYGEIRGIDVGPGRSVRQMTDRPEVPGDHQFRLVVTGHGRHGKDKTSEMLAANLGTRWCSSSWFAAQRVIYPALKDRYPGECGLLDCFEDRHSHRDTWYRLICEYNQDDLGRLGRELFEHYQIYCGIRNVQELQAIRQEHQELQIPDLVIWVDASKRRPPEPLSSMTITREDADVVVDNNQGLDELERRLWNLCRVLRPIGKKN